MVSISASNPNGPISQEAIRNGINEGVIIELRGEGDQADMVIGYSVESEGEGFIEWCNANGIPWSQLQQAIKSGIDWEYHE